MNENSVVSLRQKDEIDDPLTEILRVGARRLIVQAVEIEFETFLALKLVGSFRMAASVLFATDMIRLARSRPGLARSKCKAEGRDRSAPEAGERIRFIFFDLTEMGAAHEELDVLLPAPRSAWDSAGDFRRFGQPCWARTRQTSRRQ